MNQEIIDYIIQAERHGLTEFEIKQNLLNAGWEAPVVEENFVFARAADNRLVSDKKQTGQTSQKPELTPQERALMSYTSGVTITEETIKLKSTGTEKKSFFQRPLFWSFFVLLLLASTGAYGYFFWYHSPENTWEKFTANYNREPYSSNFVLSYTDKENATEIPGFFGGLESFSLEFSGSGYSNNQEAGTNESSSKVKYKFTSGSSSFETGFEYLYKNQVLYLNVGDNPLVSTLSGLANDGQKIEWAKIDFNKLSGISENDKDSANSIKQVVGSDFDSLIQKIWTDKNIVKLDQNLGSETLDGIKTFHYKNSLDKNNLKNAISEFADKALNKVEDPSGKPTQENIKLFKETINLLIDKLEVKEFETWVSKSDSKLLKIHILTNAPSFNSFMKDLSNSSLSSLEKGDSQRISDIEQIKSALETYKDQNGGYPEANTGIPVGLTPDYITQIPTAPASEGSCTDYFNGYWYKTSGTAKTVNGKTVYSSYQMTFCLGADYMNYSAGIGKLTPNGIESNINCPATEELCVFKGTRDNSNLISAKAKQIVDSLSFNADFLADVSYYDYGKIEDVNEPTGAFDIIDSYQKSTEKSVDAQILSEVRLLSSSLEQYFIDQGSYPNILNEMVPKYLGSTPEPLKTTNGSCSVSDNSYTYKKIGSKSFTLNFCFNKDVGGYSAGKHILTENGIK